MLLLKLFPPVCTLAFTGLPDPSSNNHTGIYPTRTQIYSILDLLSRPASEEFFSHVRDDVKYNVTGKSFLSGVWTTKASYRADTWARIGPLLKPPGLKIRVVEGEEGIIVGQDGWSAADLESIDTYTLEGVPYNQAYTWHIRFDTSGLITEIKVWLDSLTLEKVLGAKAAKQILSGTIEI